jgi:hypothetical protein
MDEKAAAEMRTRDEGGAAQRAAAGRHLAAEEVMNQVDEETGEGHRQASARRGLEEEGMRTPLEENVGGGQSATVGGLATEEVRTRVEEGDGAGHRPAGAGPRVEAVTGQASARREAEEHSAGAAGNARGYSHRRVLLTDVKEGAHRVLMAKGGEPAKGGKPAKEGKGPAKGVTKGGKGGAKGAKGAVPADGANKVRPSIYPKP